MSKKQCCGHSIDCLEKATLDGVATLVCQWCRDIAASEQEKCYLLGEAAKLKSALAICEEELADSERDNRALVEVLGEKAIQLHTVEIDECPVCTTFIGFYATVEQHTLTTSNANIDASGVTCAICGHIVVPADKIPGVIPASHPTPIVPRTARLMLRPTKRPHDGESAGG